MRKRIVGAFVALLMVIGTLPSVAYAYTDNEYYSHTSNEIVFEYEQDSSNLDFEVNLPESVTYGGNQEEVTSDIIEDEDTVVSDYREAYYYTEPDYVDYEEDYDAYYLDEDERNTPVPDIEYGHEIIIFDSEEEPDIQVIEDVHDYFEDISATFIGIEPFVTVGISMVTCVDATLEIEAGEIMEVTVSWLRVPSIAHDIVAIRASDGADILIEFPTDVEYNQGTGTISNVIRGDGNVRVTANTPRITPALNEVIFRVRAPSGTDSFTLSVQVGSEVAAPTALNSTQETFNVNTPLYVEVTPNVVVGNENFVISGGSNFGSNHIIAVYLRHRDVINNNVRFIAEIRYPTAETSHDGSFVFQPNIFPHYAPPGLYIVEVVAVDPSTNNIVGRVLYEYVEFVAFTTLGVEPGAVVGTPNPVIRPGEPFVVYGETLSNFFVATLHLRHSVSGEVVSVSHETADDVNVDGSFRFPPNVFPDNAAPGLYYVEVHIFDLMTFAFETRVFRYIDFDPSTTTPTPSTITVSSTLTNDIAVDNQSFNIQGNIVSSTAHRVSVQVNNSSGTTVLSSETTDVSGNTYSVGPFQFGAIHPEGTYTVTARLYSSAGAVLATAEMDIEHTKSPAPPLTPPTITSVDSHSVMYGGGTFQITATGSEQITFDILSAFPTGVSINRTTGLILILGTAPVGTHYITIEARNDAGSDTMLFRLTVLARPAGVRSVVASSGSTFIITENNRLYAAGRNNHGQLGLGDRTDRTNFEIVKDNVRQVATSSTGHTIALTTDGFVYTWGFNFNGQLGAGVSGTQTPDLVRRRVPTLNNIIQVQAGSAYSMALNSSGAVWTWGSNNRGQLGRGTAASGASIMTPGTVPGIPAMAYIVAGCTLATSFAICRSGNLWAWGHNNYGQLGNGTTTDRTTPQQVPGMGGANRVVQVSANQFSVAAVRENGSLWTWGENVLSHGALGNGGTLRLSPSQVLSLEAVSYVSVGGSGNTIVIMQDGTLRTWGNNNVGQAGLGHTSNPQLAPNGILSLAGQRFAQVSAGHSHVIVLNEDGTILVWGDNASGQLSTGNRANQPSPTQPNFSPAP